jgi:hypothetical protein
MGGLGVMACPVYYVRCTCLTGAYAERTDVRNSAALSLQRSFSLRGGEKLPFLGRDTVARSSHQVPPVLPHSQVPSYTLYRLTPRSYCHKADKDILGETWSGMTSFGLGSLVRGTTRSPRWSYSDRFLPGPVCIDVPHFNGWRRMPAAEGGAFRTAAGRTTALNQHNRARGVLHVSALFEKYTERAIKAVMLAQQEAKSLGSPEVRTRLFGTQKIQNSCIFGHFSPLLRICAYNKHPSFAMLTTI